VMNSNLICSGVFLRRFIKVPCSPELGTPHAPPRGTVASFRRQRVPREFCMFVLAEASRGGSEGTPCSREWSLRPRARLGRLQAPGSLRTRTRSPGSATRLW
jgi:hypothetical protein